MICYRIKALVPERLVQEFERYMKAEHIPDLLKTGCFASFTFEKKGAGAFTIDYLSESQEKLDEYFDKYAEGLRSDFLSHFPTDKITLSRTISEIENAPE